MGSVEKRCPCSRGNVANMSFHFPILMMVIDTAKSNGLVAGANRRFKRFGVKETIITIIMMNVHIVG